MKTLSENFDNYKEPNFVPVKRIKYLIMAFIFVFTCVSFTSSLAKKNLKIHLYSGCTNTTCINHRYYWTFPGTNIQICLPC
jgi:hypothetical protein